MSIHEGIAESTIKDMGQVVASKMVGEDRARVLWMYREEPQWDEDSGWRFFSGQESPEYTSNPENLGVYEGRRIAEIDPDIVSLVMTPAPCAFRRNGPEDRFSEWDWAPEE